MTINFVYASGYRAEITLTPEEARVIQHKLNMRAMCARISGNDSQPSRINPSEVHATIVSHI